MYEKYLSIKDTLNEHIQNLLSEYVNSDTYDFKFISCHNETAIHLMNLRKTFNFPTFAEDNMYQVDLSLLHIKNKVIKDTGFKMFDVDRL